MEVNLRRAIWMAYQKKCYYCDESVSWRELHIDHFIPTHTDLNIKREILEELNLDTNFDFNSFKNLVPAHSSCNTSRKGKYIPTASSFSGALVITEKHIPKIYEIREKLDSNENYDNDVAQMAAYLDKGLTTAEKLYDVLSNDDETFVEIEDWESRPVRASTTNVMIHCYPPKFPDIHGSIMIVFRSLRIRDCIITFSHDEIVNKLFQGVGSPPDERYRGFILVTDTAKDICIVQLGNNRFSITMDEAKQLCYLIDKAASLYIDSVRIIEHTYKTIKFDYSKNNRFKLLRINRSLWRDILEFAREFDYENGDTEWHIFDGKAVYLKIYCGTPNDKRRDYRVFVYPEADENGFWEKYCYPDNEVWLCWDPSLLIDSPDDYLKFKNNLIWDAEYTYNWLRFKLIPRVIEYKKQKSSYLSKTLRGKYIVSPFDLERESVEQKNISKTFSEIKDLKVLEDWVNEFQNFFAIHSKHYLSIAAINGVYKSILLCLEHFYLSEGTLKYISSKLDGNNSLDKIAISINNKMKELETKTGVNGSNIEYALRSLCAIFREGKLTSNENLLIKELTTILEKLSEEFELLLGVERARKL